MGINCNETFIMKWFIPGHNATEMCVYLTKGLNSLAYGKEHASDNFLYEPKIKCFWTVADHVLV